MFCYIISVYGTLNVDLLLRFSFMDYKCCIHVYDIMYGVDQVQFYISLLIFANGIHY